MSDEIFHLLHQWEEPALWECLIKWDQQHRAQLEYAHGIPLRHKDERVEAIAIADKYAGLMSAKLGELLAVREAVERIVPDLAGPLDVRGPAEIVSPIDRAHAVRDLVRKLKSRLHAELANAVPSTPAGTQQGEGGKPKPAAKPDGPFDADGFRFAGVEVKFGKASKQYRLVMALWDKKKKSPAAPRPVEEVIAEVWGDDNETEDAAFRQLCADTRARFQKANCPLNIQQTNGYVQLSPL